MAEPEREADEGGLPEFYRHQRDSSGQARLDLRLQGMADLSAVSVDGSARWVSIGPAPVIVDADQIFQGQGPIGGVVSDIGIDPGGDADAVLYVASGYGGVWKSEDAGASWAPTMDALPGLSIGALALDAVRPSTLYAGVGSLLNVQRYLVHFAGAGLYKSVDAGGSWAPADGGPDATVFTGLDVNRIVAPGNGMVYVGTSGGLFFSADGGRNFGTNFLKYDDGKAIAFPGVVPIADAAVTGLALDTTSPAAKVWVALSGVGVFAITKLSDATDLVVSANLFANPGAPPPGTFNDIAIAQGRKSATAPTADQVLYASVQRLAADNTASFVGLFKSTDAGQSWNPTPAAGLPARLGATGADQSDYDFTFGVDPQDADRIYAGFKELWRSADATASFPEASSCGTLQIHLDQHAVAFSPATHWGAAPAAPTTLYVGNDGGLARSTDGGSHWTNLNAGVATTLFYGIDIGRGSPANNAYTYGGAQDTGTQGRRPGDAGLEWHAGKNSDGGRVAVDPADPRIVYGFSNEFLIRTADGGAHWLQGERPQNVNITGATNASPIVVTAVAHGFVNGALVTVTGVLGNTAANGTWLITVDAAKPNEFNLFGSTGNGVYTSGGVATRAARTDIAITAASNASPIVVTVADHPFQTSDSVFISGVAGNTAANGQFAIHRIDGQSFSLDGSAGNGNYTGGGVVHGPGIGRGLSAPAGDNQTRRVVLVPNGAKPADVVYVSEDLLLYRSTDRGVNFTAVTLIPVTEGDPTITALTVPDAAHLWVGLANGSVHFSSDGGDTWDSASIRTRPGPAREVSTIAIDPADPFRIAVGFSGYAEVNPKFRTGSCFLSGDGGKSWSEASGTEGNVDGNLPDLPIHDLVFDSSTAPSTLVVATDGAVLASTDAGAHWRVLGAGLPRVSCLSLAIDNGAVPRVLRVGTYGRGAFELNRPADARLVVEGSLAFGAVERQKSRERSLVLRNPGAAPLHVKSIQRLAGSVEFSLLNPAGAFDIPPHGSQEVKFFFQPGDIGVYAAEFMIDNDDPLQGLLSVFASGEAVAEGPPRLLVKSNLRFGRTGSEHPRELAMELSVAGDTPVRINSIARTGGSSDFALIGDWSNGPTIDPGTTLFPTVRFTPGSSGALQAQFRIDCDDPHGPRIVKAQGIGVSAGTSVLKVILIVLGVAAGVFVAAEVGNAIRKKL